MLKIIYVVCTYPLVISRWGSCLFCTSQSGLKWFIFMVSKCKAWYMKSLWIYIKWQRTYGFCFSGDSPLKGHNLEYFVGGLGHVDLAYYKWFRNIVLGVWVLRKTKCYITRLTFSTIWSRLLHFGSYVFNVWGSNLEFYQTGAVLSFMSYIDDYDSDIKQRSLWNTSSFMVSGK